MNGGRKIITKDMLEAARNKGWSCNQTAKHYGMHRTSIAAACVRFNVELARSKFDPQMPSTRSVFWKQVVDAETLKPKGSPVFSCKPSAIERALRQRGLAVPKLAR